ncbi:MAG TPA: hypothetical protein VJT72_14265, partial [Pseudonocardiaceae bacterium]|nr:hypothetical protein [Pseudonocardiaceae bacterium]
SRAQEYHDAIVPAGTGSPGPAVEPLAAAVVVELHSLSPDDVQAYLEAATPAHDVAKWNAVFTVYDSTPTDRSHKRCRRR